MASKTKTNWQTCENGDEIAIRRKAGIVLHLRATAKAGFTVTTHGTNKIVAAAACGSADLPDADRLRLNKYGAEQAVAEWLPVEGAGKHDEAERIAKAVVDAKKVCESTPWEQGVSDFSPDAYVSRRGGAYFVAFADGQYAAGYIEGKTGSTMCLGKADNQSAAIDKLRSSFMNLAANPLVAIDDGAWQAYQTGVLELMAELRGVVAKFDAVEELRVSGQKTEGTANLGAWASYRKAAMADARQSLRAVYGRLQGSCLGHVAARDLDRDGHDCESVFAQSG